MLGLVAAIAAASTAAPAWRSVPVGIPTDWSREQDGAVARYRSGEIAITVRSRLDGDAETSTPVLTVELPGHAPAALEGAPTRWTHAHRFTVGRWGDGRPYLLFQSFTGGAHCCNRIQLVLPERRRLGVIDIGTFDGDYLEALPKDLDGDGAPDFVFGDNAFLYRFASYADSFGPPQVVTVIDGRRADVSAQDAFRPLFESAMHEARPLCVEQSSNAACAAYVAAAARAGQYKKAWAEMLVAYDRHSRWGLEEQCRAPLADGSCPAGERFQFKDFPEALRHFLIETGYIGRSAEDRRAQDHSMK